MRGTPFLRDSAAFTPGEQWIDLEQAGGAMGNIVPPMAAPATAAAVMAFVRAAPE